MLSLCKYMRRFDRVLIDTWWNVNKILAIKSHKILTVLIDTWWNVNIILARYKIPHRIVLIDTWWNVNLGNGTQIGTTIGF